MSELLAVLTSSTKLDFIFGQYLPSDVITVALLKK
jgi:hypothetical protein